MRPNAQHARDTTMPCRLRRLIRIAIGSLFLPVAAVASAADQPVLVRESFTLNIDESAVRRLSDIREYIRTKRWEQASELLIKLSLKQGRSLVPVRTGWYVNVSQQCNRLAVELPAEGRAVYRRKIDVQAAKWLQDGIQTRDKQALHRVIRKAFCSSSGDEALLTLGQWAWDSGEFVTARRLWSQILPQDKEATDTKALREELRYPDTNQDIAAIRARLILCDVMLGDIAHAKSELAVFRGRFPKATGKIGGQEGNLHDILNAVIKQSLSWPSSQPSSEWPTFAGGPSRQNHGRRRFEIGRPRWSRPMFAVETTGVVGQQRFPRRHDPSTFPIITGGRVFYADAGAIYGLETENGAPAFLAKIKSPIGKFDQRARLYSLGENAKPLERTTGRPWFTLTTNGDKLYARMGAPVTGRTKLETRATRSSLVCLDLKRGEGKLVWKRESQSFGIGWEFEGAPIVSGDRLLIVLRKRNPETEIHIACLDANRGTSIWTTRIGTAIAAGSDEANHISHLLLTLADGRLYLSTDLGVMVALNARDGVMDWAVTYRSRNGRHAGVKPTTRKGQLTPLLIHDDVLIAAPADSNRVLAVHALTGQPLWQRAFRGGVRHLLGVSQNRLVVAGDRLWGLAPRSGVVQWNLGYENPEGFGYGRGCLSGGQVYWPMRKELLIVHAKSGQLSKRIRLNALYGRGGGNLVLVPGTLLIAEKNRLTAYDLQTINSQ